MRTSTVISYIAPLVPINNRRKQKEIREENIFIMPKILILGSGTEVRRFFTVPSNAFISLKAKIRVE